MLSNKQVTSSPIHPDLTEFSRLELAFISVYFQKQIHSHEIHRAAQIQPNQAFLQVKL